MLPAVEFVSSSIFCVTLSHISFAKGIGYSCMISLSTRSPISSLNRIFTNSPARNSSMTLSSIVSCKSIKSACGGLISITLFSMDDMDVAAEPIIWFIASLIALKCSSPSSPSVLVPSPPIIRSVITFTSCSFKTNMLLPSSPTVYPIRINTHGFSYASQISLQFAKETTGVEISTFRFTRENSVVAAVPILILAISPIVSFSFSVSTSSLGCSLLSSDPFSNALISS